MRGMHPAEPEPETIRIAAPPRPGAAAPTSAPTPAPDAWPAAVLSAIERELADCVGPVAAMLVRRAAQQHANIDALVLALLPSIESQQDRDAFSRACARHAAPGPEPLIAAPAVSVARAPAHGPVPAFAQAPAPRAPSRRTDSALPHARQAAATGPRVLSEHWQGLATRGHRDLALLPLWVAPAFAGSLLLVLWLTLNARLDVRARPLFSRIAAVPAALQGATAVAAAKPRLAAALRADAVAAQIDVRDEAQRSLITLPADGLFLDGSARLGPAAGEVLARVAQALRGQGGEIAVIGHGDNKAPTSLQFPSNWHFTRARAQAVADALTAQRVAPARAEGRAEFEPRAPNTTAAGRAQNRRIEIELRLPRPDELVS